MRRRSSEILGLGVMLALTFVAAGVGAAATTPAVRLWYPSLAKPWWTPPAWLFGPVWTTLYIGMATAAWLVWRRAGMRGARNALGLFVAQLALNALWSVLFFGMRRPDLALMEIALLWLSVLATMVAFARHSRLAGLLFIPYLSWVTFAAALNGAFWWMNRPSG